MDKLARTFTLYEVYALLEYLGVDAARLLAAKAGEPVKYANVDLGQLEAILNRVLISVPREEKESTIAAILNGSITVELKKTTDACSVSRAIEILGANKVITVDATAKAWIQPISSVPILYTKYTEGTLKQAAKENATGQTDWRLVFVTGKSLREQREISGTDPASDKQPYFWKNTTWWLDSKEDGWAKQNQPAGYYLIDFNGRWQNLTWDLQEQELQKLGSLYERVNPHIFGEAILTNFVVNKDRLAENWYHWSGVADSDAHLVFIGYLDADGLHVSGYSRGNSDPLLWVCLFRKFDF